MNVPAPSLGEASAAPLAANGPEEPAGPGESRPEVRLERPRPSVAVVTISRPERRNALGWATWTELEEALAEVDADPEIGAVVLTGEGVGFSAGGDLRSLRPSGTGATAGAARLALAHRAVLALHGCGKPTVAAVEGFAVGAGWSLVLACDLVVAAEGAFFAAPFLRRGLLPDAGAGWFLPRAVGHHRSVELLFLGDRLPAERAAELGLVNHLVPPGDSLERALDLASRLADGPPNALALAKRLLRSGQAPSLESYLEAELLAVALNSHGSEVAEGRSAFLERRQPRFRRPQPD